jgi:ATP-dependent protease HslVU (ClpYQ) peptidase subunit
VSVIAWDGKTLAADKRMCFGTMIMTTTKIFRVGDALCAYAGEAGGGEEMLAWFKGGAIPSEFPSRQRTEEWAGLLVVRRGEILKYEKAPYPLRVEDKNVAIGCGRDFAMAAMHLGHDAKTAVEVTIALDSACGNGIDCLTLD